MRALLVGGPADGDVVDANDDAWVIYVRQPRPFDYRPRPLTCNPYSNYSIRYLWVPVAGAGMEHLRGLTVFKLDTLSDDEVIQRLLAVYQERQSA